MPFLPYVCRSAAVILEQQAGSLWRFGPPGGRRSDTLEP
jgi:hypothetical protein